MKKGPGRKKWAEKVAWMLAHKQIWGHVDIDRPERFKRHFTSLYMRDRTTWKAIADGLKDAGLVSRSTGTIDVAVKELIAAARDAEVQPDNPEERLPGATA